MQTRLMKDPYFCTVDFKDAWAAAIRFVFPFALIIICHFHVVQLVVKALLSEFERLKQVKFSSIISECKNARKISLFKEKGEPVPDNPKFAHRFVSGWFQFQERIFNVCEAKKPAVFTTELEALFLTIQSWNQDIKEKFALSLETKKPKRGFTMKSMKYFKEELNKKWRGVLRSYRQVKEEEKHQFHHSKYLLLKKPCNLTSWEEETLGTYIKSNPWTLPYRAAIVRFYWALDDPWRYGTSLKFLRRIIMADSHPSLETALNTLDERHEEIFNFMRVVERYPELASKPGFRVNPEPSMRKVNNMARVQFGLRSDTSAVLRLGQLFGCPIMLSKTILDVEEVSLT